ncbi:MAG: Ig-like domain-containing protein [Armatimonadota bacterium]
MTTLTGFAPNTPVELQILRNGAPLTDPTTGNPLILQFTTDQNGNVPRFPLWDLGADPQTGQASDATGTYTVVASAQGKQVTLRFEVLAGRGVQSAPGRQAEGSGTVVVLAGSPPRYPMGSVNEGEQVLVEGFGFTPNQQVKVFVVRDREGWQGGEPLTDETGGAETITINAQGDLPRTTVWVSASRLDSAQTDGDFDLVVDVNRNDRYDAGIDVVSGLLATSFTVQKGSRSRQGQGHLAVELAASTQGKFKDEFNVTERVGVWVNPPWRPLKPGAMVRKYVVLHKDNWANGDVLVDVTGRPEWDLVRYACRNQYSCPVWYPPLVPGKYDVIIDVDEDGKYTLGTDYIDAGLTPGSQVGAGFVVSGTFPPIRMVLSAGFPTINHNESTTLYAQVQTQEGLPVANGTVNFSITSGQGGQLSSTSATTDSAGMASVTLTATQPGTTLIIRGTITHSGQTASAEVSVRVRAPGELNVIIR